MATYTPLSQVSSRTDKPNYDDSDSRWTYNDSFLENSQQSVLRQSFYQGNRKYIVSLCLILIFNIATLLTAWHWTRLSCPYEVYGPDIVYTPARSAIAYESQTWDPTNIFFRNGSVNPGRLHKEFGPPSPSSENAWEELLQYQSIRLSKEELGEYRHRPGLVELADGSGYFATLSAYHSLHCIKKLHHLMYFDHYYSKMSEHQVMLVRHHAEHCLNILYQTVQCNADLSILPMQWGRTTSAPIGLDEGHHQCVQWDKIDNWMRERSINVFEPGLLVHPSLGEAFPTGKGNEVGIALDELMNMHN